MKIDRLGCGPCAIVIRLWQKVVIDWGIGSRSPMGPDAFGSIIFFEHWQYRPGCRLSGPAAVSNVSMVLVMGSVPNEIRPLSVIRSLCPDASSAWVRPSISAWSMPMPAVSCSDPSRGSNGRML